MARKNLFWGTDTQTQVVAVLLGHKADPIVARKDGKTAVDLTEEQLRCDPSHRWIAKFLAEEAVVYRR